MRVAVCLVAAFAVFVAKWRILMAATKLTASATSCVAKKAEAASGRSSVTKRKESFLEKDASKKNKILCKHVLHVSQFWAETGWRFSSFLDQKVA